MLYQFAEAATILVARTKSFSERKNPYVCNIIIQIPRNTQRDQLISKEFRQTFFSNAQ